MGRTSTPCRWAARCWSDGDVPLGLDWGEGRRATVHSASVLGATADHGAFARPQVAELDGEECFMPTRCGKGEVLLEAVPLDVVADAGERR